MARSNSQINVAIALDTAPLEAGQKRAPDSSTRSDLLDRELLEVLRL